MLQIGSTSALALIPPGCGSDLVRVNGEPDWLCAPDRMSQCGARTGSAERALPRHIGCGLRLANVGHADALYDITKSCNLFPFQFRQYFY